LAIGLLLQADAAGAVAELRRAVLIVPLDGEARELLEGATALAEKPSGAAASRVRSALAALHVKTAERLGARGKRSESLSHLRSAIELAPESGEAHARVGALLVEDGRLNEAAIEIQRALSLAPGSAAAHNDMGYVWFLKGDTRAAIAEYREALRLQPDLELAQANLKRALESERTPRR